jgi:hypothetical protein
MMNEMRKGMVRQQFAKTCRRIAGLRYGKDRTGQDVSAAAAPVVRNGTDLERISQFVEDVSLALLEATRSAKRT